MFIIIKAQDGKYYNTDVVESSKNAEPIKMWLANLGSEKIDKTFDPSLTAQRSIDLYRTKGYDEKWIAKRIKGIQGRKEFTDVWKENGITEVKEYKQYRGLRKESLRDNMSRMEVVLADLGEETAKELAIVHKPYGLEENKKIAKTGGNTVKVARDDLEKNLILKMSFIFRIM